MAGGQIGGNSTGVIIEVFLQDSTSTTGAGKTGLLFSDITCYYKRNDGTAAVQVTMATITTLGTWETGGFKKVSDANMPGVYEFDPPNAAFVAGANFNEVTFFFQATGTANKAYKVFISSGTSSNEIIHSGTMQAGSTGTTAVLDTGASAVDSTYNLTVLSIVGGTGAGQSRAIISYVGSTRTATVSTWTTTPDATSVFNITPAGQAQVVSYLTGQAPLQPATAGRTLNVSAGGVADANVTTWSGTAVSGTIPPDAIFIRSGTAQAGGASTITLDSGASATNNLYQNEVVFIRSGTGSGQAATIASYVGSTKVATIIGTWATNPDNTSVFTIYANGAVSATVSGGVNVTQWNGTNVASPNVAGVPLVDIGYTKGTVSTGVAGYVGVDWSHVNAPTTAVALTNTTISTSQVIASMTGNVGGNVTGSVGSVLGNVGGNVAGTVNSVTVQTVRTNTAQAGTSTTIQLDSGASATNNLYNGCDIALTGSTGAGQTRTIIGYNGATKQATIDRAWTTTPVNTTTFSIFATNSPALNASLQVTSNIATVAIRSGTAQAGGSNTITLDAGASSTNSLYNGDLIALSGGTGAGQVRTIIGYNGTTKVATVDKAWNVNPDNTSTFSIFASTTASQFSDQGVAQAGAATTITLASTASAVNGIYVGSIVTILSGTGAGETAEITAYNGSTKVATVNTAWSINPDTTSAYAVIPTASGTGTSGTTTDVNVVSWAGTAVGVSIAGIPRVDIVDIGGSALSTTTAQLGVNVVKYNNVTAQTDINGFPAVDVEDFRGATSAGTPGYAGIDWGQVANKTTVNALTNTSIASVSGAVGSVTGSVGSVTAGVTVTTNNDKTGYSLSVSPPTAAQVATAIWTDTTGSDFTVTSSPGSILVAQLGGTFTTTSSSIFSVASLANAPTGGSAPTVSQIATAVWQDATAGDFTTSGSIGKSLFTSGVVPGAAGGLFIAGTNAATTVTTSFTTTFTGNLTGTIGNLAAGAKTDVENAVWNTVLASHLTAGSTGAALNTSSSAGDPWTTALPASYAPGQAGYIIGNFLTVAPPTAGAIATAIWEDLIAGGDFGTTGSIGKLLSTFTFTAGNVNANTQATAAALTFDLTGDITGNLSGSVGSVTAGITIDSGDLDNIADAVLKRDMSAVTGEATRSPLNAFRALRNKFAFPLGTYTVYKEDDATEAWTATPTTDPAAIPVTGITPI